MEKSILNMSEKVVIITGAATGLGATTANLLAQSGANVLVNYLPGQEAQAQAIEESCEWDASQILCHAGDIVRVSDCTSIVQAAIEKWGRVDILVNNAGINKPVDHRNLDGLNAQDFIDTYKVNVVGAYQMTRAVASSMKKHGHGVVVNISSASGEDGYGSSIAYSASKGAMNTMTKSLARALGPEIRINAVCPGFIDTPLWDKLNLSEEQRKERLNEFIDLSPLKAPPTAEIIARCVLFLASDLSAHLTGQLITVDGGVGLGVYQSMLLDH